MVRPDPTQNPVKLEQVMGEGQHPEGEAVMERGQHPGGEDLVGQAEYVWDKEQIEEEKPLGFTHVTWVLIASLAQSLILRQVFEEISETLDNTQA